MHNKGPLRGMEPSKEERLLAENDEQCCIELTPSAAASSSSQHDGPHLQDISATTTTTTTTESDGSFLIDGCYLPLSSHVDDNPTITVYDETKEMLLSAILMYGVVHLRKLANKMQQQQQQQEEKNETIDATATAMRSMLAEHLLQLPISAKDVVRLVSKYREDIVTEIGRESTVDLYLTAFDAIHTSQSSRELELEYNSATLKIALVSFDVVVVEDEHADNDLVYAICVDTARRRITVSFRGCSCRKDWLVCCQTILKVLENPLYQDSHTQHSTASSSLPGVPYKGGRPFSSHGSLRSSSTSTGRRQPSSIAIHSGYYNYLFDDSKGETKFDAILRQLNNLLKQYPGYNIYVTGHSLGAALATVFSFHAAASNRLLPADPSYEAPTVTCINFASPMVGNMDFETAFRELEDLGRIRCLRVTNYYDIFTQLPDRGNWLYLLLFVPWIGISLLGYFGVSILFFMCLQRNVYRHVGMNLQMYRGLKCWTSWLPFQKCKHGMCGQEDGDETELDHEYRYWYKIKHSRGTAENFALRVVQDFKKHMKQLVQRLVALPLLTNFDANHRAHEHLRRLTGLEHDLKQIHMRDLYSLRTPPSSPVGSTTQIPTDLCIV